MASTTSSSHSCWICGKEVSLLNCKTDEQGHAVHERCYIAWISLNWGSRQPCGRRRDDSSAGDRFKSLAASLPTSIISMSTACILLVDDFAEWRAEVRSILQEWPELNVVHEASDGLEAIVKAAELQPDLILLDIGLPGLNGFEAATRIRKASPRSRIIFLTQESDSQIRDAAFATGATEVVLKQSVLSELLPAIEAALEDGHYSPTVPN